MHCTEKQGKDNDWNKKEVEKIDKMDKRSDWSKYISCIERRFKNGGGQVIWEGKQIRDGDGNYFTVGPEA